MGHGAHLDQPGPFNKAMASSLHRTRHDGLSAASEGQAGLFRPSDLIWRRSMHPNCLVV